MKALSQQSKALRKLIVKRFAFSFLVYTCIMLLALALFETYLSPAIGNLIADSTSQWEYATLEETEMIFDGNHRMIQQDTVEEDNENGIIRYRVLDTYAELKNAKDAALPIAFVLGVAGLIFYSLNKFVDYFDELTASVALLFKDKSAPIALSTDLAITQNELTAIRDTAIRNEQAARHAKQRKNELIAYIAHDIRTPLTSIMGYISLLESGKDIEEEKRVRYIGVVHAQARKLNDMLDNFFDIARFNAQEITIAKQNVDIQTLCLQVADELYPPATNRNLTLEVSAPLTSSCECDPHQMARALSNIVRNAISYATPGTPITIEAMQDSDTTTILIKNRGITIAPDSLKYVFDKFFREDKARNADRGGAGLGLAIAQEIVEAHDGTISASSEDSLTRFTISFPTHQ